MNLQAKIARARRLATPAPMSEYEIHVQIVAELRAAGRLFFHVPNEIKVAPQYRAKLKRLGVSAGVPDLIIVTPNRCGRPSALELKSERGGLKAHQREWLERLGACGWSAACTHGLEEARAQLRAWGYL